MNDSQNETLGHGVLVHEWYEAAGGAEKVFDAMLDAFPGADALTLWNETGGFVGREARETWIARTRLKQHKAVAIPAILPTWRMQRGEYDWALVSSHNFAHHVDFGRDSADMKKFLYVHSPARYLWTPEVDQRGQHPAVRAVAPALRRYDRFRAREAYAIAANSHFVQDRIRHSWHLESNVIYPPVDVTRLVRVPAWADELVDSDRQVFEQLPESYVLAASRFVPYKRLDAAITAGEAAGLPVVLAGRGPEEANLRAAAAASSVPVHFVISPSDELLYSLIQHAAAFVFLALEDFGIIPVEAMALGTPVVCLDIGGTGESVVDGLTGVHVSLPDDARALGRAVEMAASLDPAACIARARDFSRERFVQELRDFVGCKSPLVLTTGESL